MNNYKTRYGDKPISRKYRNIIEDVFPNTSLRSPKERPPDYQGCSDDMNHFMAMACLASQRSKDPARRVIA
jgi:deoxycytidylate deaminase